MVVSSRFQGEIEVEGNQFFNDEIYTSAFQQQPGMPIDENQLDKDISWLNRSPYRAASIIASPGSEPGTTKLVVQAREADPLIFFVGGSNTGSQSTKEERSLFGLNWGNAFGLDHQMSLQVTGDPEFDH